jgi:hypothetical protein
MAGQHLDKINQSKSASKKTQAQPELEHHHKPFRLEDADVMDLQRQLGNQATQNVLGIQRKADAGLPSLPGVIQTKMTVNEPGDEYEHEADRVAHEVMTMPDPVQREGMEEEEMMMKPIQREGMEEEEEMMMKPIQRQEMEEEEMMMKPIQREGMEEEEEMMMKPISSLQRDSAAGVPPVTEDMEAQIEGAKGSGQPIPEDTRSFLEPRFGQDFSDVRIHTGAESNDLSNKLQARAFTTGSDIFFRDSDYNPNSDAGKELLAHELTHVVQQGGSSELKTKKDDDCC